MKSIKPARLSSRLLFAFWMIVFVLPVITAKVLLNMHKASRTHEQKLEQQAALRHEMELFSADLSLTDIIESQTKLVKQHLESEFLEDNALVDAKMVCSRASHLFKQNDFCQPALIAAYVADTDQTEVLRLAPDYLNPGRKSIEIMLSYLRSLEQNQITEQQTRLYKQICRVVFGDLLRPSEQAGILVSGFLGKGKGDRAFIYHNQLKIGKSTTKLSFMVVFAESKIGLRYLLDRARQSSNNPELTRNYALLRTSVDRDFFIDRQNRLHYVAPLPPAVLRTGSHRLNDWYSKAISSGVALKKPGRLPFAVVSLRINNSLDKSVSSTDLANFLLLIIFFTGTALVYQVKTDRFAKLPINRKFALSILLSTTLPFAVLVLAAYRYAGQFSQTMIQNALYKMSNNLYIIEANIHNNNRYQKFKISALITKLKANAHKSPETLKQILNEGYSRLFIGYVLFRNDATLLERLPPVKSISGDDYGKLLLMRDIILAQAYDLFENIGVLSENFSENIKSVKDFKRWHAFSVHYTPIDRASFCNQDGEYFPAQILEQKNILFSTHNLFPEKGKENSWACLTLLSDGKEVVEAYLDRRSGQVFTSFANNSVTHTAIYRYNAPGQLDRQKAWPQNALRDNLMLQAASSLSASKTETAWFNTDKNGMVSLFCARVIADMPFVIASRSEIHFPAVLVSFLPVLFLAGILYLLFLVKLLSLLLTDSFIRPVNMMMQGLAALDHGHYPVIVDPSNNELGQLTGDFNNMVEGMRQRRILERFISAEVSQTIANSGSDPLELAGRLVHRAIMFIHIRDFDNICEQIEPESVISLLNLYFSRLEPSISSLGGQIDKYIGDAIMVSFASERTNGRPELAAAKTALICRKNLTGLNQELKAQKLPEITLGTGIAAGPVILGQIGARNGRKDFTLIGDAVNLAARLESASHFDNSVHILVADIIKEKAVELDFSFHDNLKVKGKKTTVKVFELEEKTT